MEQAVGGQVRKRKHGRTVYSVSACLEPFLVLKYRFHRS